MKVFLIINCIFLQDCIVKRPTCTVLGTTVVKGNEIYVHAIVGIARNLIKVETMCTNQILIFKESSVIYLN